MVTFLKKSDGKGCILATFSHFLEPFLAGFGQNYRGNKALLARSGPERVPEHEGIRSPRTGFPHQTKQRVFCQKLSRTLESCQESVFSDTFCEPNIIQAAPLIGLSRLLRKEKSRLSGKHEKSRLFRVRLFPLGATERCEPAEAGSLPKAGQIQHKCAAAGRQRAGFRRLPPASPAP